MRNWTALLAAALGVALLGGLSILSMDRTLGKLCGNAPIDEVVSPDGARKAVVFQRSCGATTGDSTHVSILPADASLPDEIGNLVTADTDHGRAPGGPGGGPKMRVVWRGNSTLAIFHHPNARLFGARTVHDEISILYQDDPQAEHP